MLVKQYEGEYPEKCIQEFCKFTGKTKNDVDEIIEEWRSNHIWDFKNDKYQLKKAIWHEYL